MKTKNVIYSSPKLTNYNFNKKIKLVTGFQQQSQHMLREKLE